MRFQSKVRAQYKVVAYDPAEKPVKKGEDMLKDVDAVQAAMEKVFEKKWVNYGDVNPSDHGGLFVRLDNGDLEVVETGDYEPEGKTVFYLKTANISAQDLSKDGAKVISFVGAENAKDLEDLIFQIILGWTAYHGGGHEEDVEVATPQDDENYEEDRESTYWSALKKYGIEEKDI